MLREFVLETAFNILVYSKISGSIFEQGVVNQYFDLKSVTSVICKCPRLLKEWKKILKI